jgi:hypothetical protein
MPGENCLPDQVCSGNSWCRDSICRCLNGYQPFLGRCRHNYLNINNDTVSKANETPNDPKKTMYHWKTLVF